MEDVVNMREDMHNDLRNGSQRALASKKKCDCQLQKSSHQRTEFHGHHTSKEIVHDELRATVCTWTRIELSPKGEEWLLNDSHPLACVALTTKIHLHRPFLAGYQQIAQLGGFQRGP